MENEVWQDIEGYKGLYQVSNLGRVKSLGNNRNRKEKILKSAKNNKGYLIVGLSKENKKKIFLLHRLVAQVFIPNPNNYPIVNHKNETPTDCRVENLEWCTQKYNVNYGSRNEKASKALKGKLKGKKKSKEHIEKVAKAISIPIVQLTKNDEYIATYQSATQVGRDLGFNNSNIIQCCKGKLKTAYKFKWQYLSDYQKAI